MSTFYKKLFCELSPVELEEIGRELSEAVIEHDKAVEKKRTLVKELNEHIGGIYDRIRRLSDAIHEKGEYRPVECQVNFHKPMIGQKETIRLDTGELIATEPMDANERQENLFGETKELDKMYGAGPEQEPLPSPEPPPDQAGAN